MRSLIALVVVCLASSASAGPIFGKWRKNQIASLDKALDRVLPTNGAGLPVMNTDLCTKYSSELTGNYFCLRGDGTQSSANGMTLSPVGPQNAGNLMTFPQDFTNAAWTKSSSGTTITVTADQAIGPNGQLTADRVTLPAVASGGFARVFQGYSTTNLTGQNVTIQIKVKGVSGSGSTFLWSPNAAQNAVVCSFNSTTWTTCSTTIVSPGAATYLGFGCQASNNGMLATDCMTGADIYVDEARMETGTTASAFWASPAVATTTPRVCPNGPDCSSISTQVLGTGNAARWVTANAASPTGSFSVCGVANLDSLPSSATLFDKNNGSVFQFLYNLGAGGLQFYVNGTQVSGGTSPTRGAWHLMCATYQYVGNGTSVARVYLDGSQTSTSSTMPGPPAVSATTPFIVGNSNNLVNPFLGRAAVALYTEKVLSPTTIQSMAASVFGTWTTKKGNAVTFTRSSAKYCTASDGSMTLLPANRPCIHTVSGFGGPSWSDEGSTTNNITRSQELDNAAWTKGTGGACAVAPTVTADQGVAPDGTTTADRVQWTGSCTGSSYVLQNNSTGGVATVRSLYVKGYGGTSGNLPLCVGGAVGQCVLCPFTGSSWTRCTYALPSSAAVQTNYFIGCDSSTYGGTCSAGGDVLVWGLQSESSTVVTSYVATTGTSAARSGDSPVAISTPANLSTTTYCVGADAQPTKAWSAATHWLIAIGTNGGANNTDFYGIGPSFQVYDGTAALKSRAASATLSGTTKHSLAACNNNGTLQIYDSLAAVSMGTASGTGAGVPSTHAATTYIGAGNSSPGGDGQEIGNVYFKNGTSP